MEKKDKELLNIISQTITDTRYIKDQATPCSHIYKTFSLWILFYTIVSLIAYLYYNIGTNLSLIEREWYFPVSRILSIVLFSLSLIAYFLILRKQNMSLKEKDFLYFYSIIPISLIFSRIIYPISYYLGSNILIELYNTLSLDLLILLFSSFIIHYYFKNKYSKLFIFYNIIVFIANMIFFSTYITSENPSTLFININNIISQFRNHGVFVIIHYLITIISIKKVLKKND